MPTVKKETISPVLPSERKLRSLKSLSVLGLKVSDGYDYGLHEALADADLAKTRRSLSNIKTSVSEEVVRERDDS